MCTTLSNTRDIDDPTPGGCENWSSCEEWCLSKVDHIKTFKYLLRTYTLLFAEHLGLFFFYFFNETMGKFFILDKAHSFSKACHSVESKERTKLIAKPNVCSKF